MDFAFSGHKCWIATEFTFYFPFRKPSRFLISVFIRVLSFTYRMKQAKPSHRNSIEELYTRNTSTIIHDK